MRTKFKLLSLLFGTMLIFGTMIHAETAIEPEGPGTENSPYLIQMQMVN